MIVRNSQNNKHKSAKKLISAFASLSVTNAEKLSKKLFCGFPVSAIDAVLDLRRFDFALYKSRILKLFKVLRHGSLRYRKLIVDISKIAAVPACQEIHYRYSGRVSQCLCITGQLLLFQ